jgi:FixJ family two-component response regulator
MRTSIGESYGSSQEPSSGSTRHGTRNEMTTPDPPRILIVDDEEAILETMSFTFMDTYEVFTTTDAQKALGLLDEHAPIACVITDQRMPGMTGVEFLTEVYERYRDTSRIMLTGFADADATISAINDGHVYAYVNKPWEPDELKQIVRRAVEHNRLSSENTRLVSELRATNVFLEAVMDRLDTGALAVDAQGVVRAANRPAREFLQLQEDPRGTQLASLLERLGVERLAEVVDKLMRECGGSFEEIELPVDGRSFRLRISAQQIDTGDGAEAADVGSVILFKEVSHEPLRRSFEEIVGGVAQEEGELRARLEEALVQMGELGAGATELGVSSPSMAEFAERLSRTQTAIQNWLDVDEVLAREEYPDAQMLMDRMRVASQRWPYVDELPARVRELNGRVEAYYESGENLGKRIL